MKRTFAILLSLFLTLVMVSLAQDKAPKVVPDPKPLNTDNYNLVFDLKNKQIDELQVTLAQQKQRIDQLTTALISKNDEMKAALDGCAASSKADSKGEPKKPGR